MARRIRLLDFRLSDGPHQAGVSSGDIVGCSRIVNAAQERLLYDEAAGDSGWIGGWTEVAISVPRTNPYITCPRGFSRLEAIDVCGRPIPLHNQFFEYLEFGTGRLPKCDRWNRRGDWLRNVAGFARNYASTFQDPPPGQNQIMIVPENVLDAAPNPLTGATARVLVQGTCHGVPVGTQDGPNTVPGEFLTITQPYALTVNSFDSITGLQKDQTLGNIQILATDPNWGSSEIISVMEPTELVANYRRYYLNGLPPNCCPYRRNRRIAPSGTPLPTIGCPPPQIPMDLVEVTALAKLELIPVHADPDYLLIQSLEALKLECMAGYMYGMQDSDSKTQAAAYHAQAIKILIGQSYAEEGKTDIAMNFAPFGRADWDRVNLSMQ